MNKQQILDEIKRTAAANDGVPLGMPRFFRETGINEGDWLGKYWARWNDAVREAGLAPNKMQEGYDEKLLIEAFIRLIRELGHVPVRGDIGLKRRMDPSFPSHVTFQRLGPKSRLISKVLDYCRTHAGFDDVIRLCPEVTSDQTEESVTRAEARTEEIGFVYLIKSGRYFKVGRTNALGRREYELAIQLPQKATTVHTIRTDDPCGIEEYWHKRFGAKRTNGEWFELDAEDVRAFKRRKFM